MNIVHSADKIQDAVTVTHPPHLTASASALGTGTLESEGSGAAWMKAHQGVKRQTKRTYQTDIMSIHTAPTADW